jgi:hypothetical protein
MEALLGRREQRRVARERQRKRLVGLDAEEQRQNDAKVGEKSGEEKERGG